MPYNTVAKSLAAHHTAQQLIKPAPLPGTLAHRVQIEADQRNAAPKEEKQDVTT